MPKKKEETTEENATPKTFKNQISSPWVELIQEDEIVKEYVLPAKDDILPFERYSVPVLVSDGKQVAPNAYRWDYEKRGWVRSDLSAGMNPSDYIMPFEPTHWMLLPGFK